MFLRTQNCIVQHSAFQLSLRPHLIERLNAGTYGKITLVSAPAGYGKSTLVSQWLDSLVDSPQEATSTDSHKVSWLNLEEEDNSLPRFLASVVDAVEANCLEKCETVRSILRNQSQPTVEVLVDALIESLVTLPGPLILVLDDLHFVDDSAIFFFIARLVQYGPATFHLVLITRVDPPLPLNRWRATGQLHEVRLHELSFTMSETSTFFARQLDTLPDNALIAMLHQRLEGWPVGIRLAAPALRNQTNYGEFAAHFKSAGSRYIGDYLVDEVLDQQPAPIQRFLIVTAILDRFCAGLCAAVAQIDEASAQDQIGFWRANLFVIELSSPPFWYRYHHQFQSMLLSRLHERTDQESIIALHHIAADWLATHHHVDDALRHLIAIPDYEAAADLIEAQRVSAINEQRFLELESWIGRIPAHVLNQRPFLLACLAWLHHYRHENAECLAAAQRAADRLDTLGDAFPNKSRQLLDAEIVALRMSLTPRMYTPEVLVKIRQAWMDLRPQLADTHCVVTVWLSAVAQRLGDIGLASEIALTTFEEATGCPEIARGRLLYSCGLDYYYECNLAEAEKMHVRVYVSRGVRSTPDYDPYVVWSCQHCTARGEVDQAQRYYSRSLSIHSIIMAGSPGQASFLLRIYDVMGQPEQGAA